MKKILMVSATLLAASFAFAQETDTTVTEMEVITEVKPEARPKTVTQVKTGAMQPGVKGQMVKGMRADIKEMMPVPPVGAWGSTGDKAIDEQLKSLRKELEVKMKTLVEEYQLKAKAIIGNRKMTLPTQADMKAKIDAVRENVKNGSITPEMKAKMDAEMRMRATSPNGNVSLPPVRPPIKLNAPTAPKEQASALQSFFRSLFGGNAVEAQAGVESR